MVFCSQYYHCSHFRTDDGRDDEYLDLYKLDGMLCFVPKTIIPTDDGRDDEYLDRSNPPKLGTML